MSSDRSQTGLGGRSVAAFVAVALMATLGPQSARADGRRDLEDGIAFYENLDTERAEQRLRAAVAATELSSEDRARAGLYLGLVLYEGGKEPQAEQAWKQALAADPTLTAPRGTSPKVVGALERIRKGLKGSRSKPPPPGPATPPIAKPEPKPPPKLDPVPLPPPAPALVGPPPPSEDASGPSAWLWVGIGAAVIGGSVLGIVLASQGGGSCASGGCVRFRVGIEP